MDHGAELDRQLQNLRAKGYAEVAGLSEQAFLALGEALRSFLPSLPKLERDMERGILPFVLVVQENVVSAEEQMSRVEYRGKRGVTKLYPHSSEDFSSIEKVIIPTSPLYLLIDIDRGNETRNIPPNEAMKTIKASSRSPLTLAEGIALVTQYPEFLIKNHCFSLLASRHPGDQRVPALWINGQKEPNLGWCWDGNPHTWLGSASCQMRLGA